MNLDLFSLSHLVHRILVRVVGNMVHQCNSLVLYLFELNGQQWATSPINISRVQIIRRAWLTEVHHSSDQQWFDMVSENFDILPLWALFDIIKQIWHPSGDDLIEWNHGNHPTSLRLNPHCGGGGGVIVVYCSKYRCRHDAEDIKKKLVNNLGRWVRDPVNSKHIALV